MLRKGFTLVEVLVVVTIIGIIASILYTAISQISSPIKPQTVVTVPITAEIPKTEATPIQLDDKKRYYVKIEGEPFIITYNGPGDAVIEPTNMLLSR